MEKITKDMYVYQVLEISDIMTEIFLKHGLNCVGCPGATTESIEEAAKGHSINLNNLLKDLNKYAEE